MSSILNLIYGTPAPDDTSNQKKLVKHSFIEFSATTVFVYFGTLSAVSTGTAKLSDGTGTDQDVARIMPIAFTFGVTIMCLAYSIGHITGGHMNPGVSFLMFLHRQISLTKMLCYWIAQFFGSVLASALVYGSVNHLTQPAELMPLGTAATDNGQHPPFLLGSTTLNDKLSIGNGFLLELMGSFFFYFVIAQTALDEKGIARSKFPAIPIGFSLVVVHICLIPFTGCGVNPARTFGPAVVTCLAATDDSCGAAAVGEYWWIYFVAPFLAAFLVAEISFLMHWDVDGGSAVAAATTTAVQHEDDIMDKKKKKKKNTSTKNAGTSVQYDIVTMQQPEDYHDVLLEQKVTSVNEYRRDHHHDVEEALNAVVEQQQQEEEDDQHIQKTSSNDPHVVAVVPLLMLQEHDNDKE